MTKSIENLPAQNNPRLHIGLYFGILWLFFGLGRPDGGLPSIPVQFYLKDGLHLGPQQMAVFTALVGAPVYAGFALGFIRDRYRLWRWGDRGYFLLTAPLMMGCYIWLSNGSISYGRLLTALLISTLSAQMLNAALQGLMTVIAQRNLMTGRLTALSSVVGAVPAMISALAGGWLVSHVAPRVTFLLSAGSMSIILICAFWRLRSVDQPGLDHVCDIEGGLQSVKRLLLHRPLWPAAIIILCWTFAPGWQTPLFYFLTEKLKISSAVYGTSNAVFAGFNAVAVGFYGFLCRWVPLKRLLWVGTVLGVISCPMYLLVHSNMEALVISAFIGLFVGIGYTAFFDLLMRSYPKGLEGTSNMLIGTIIAISASSSDLLGAWLYQRGGFALALIITTLTSCIIFLILPFVPSDLISWHDGETQKGIALSEDEK